MNSFYTGFISGLIAAVLPSLMILAALSQRKLRALGAISGRSESTLHD